MRLSQVLFNVMKRTKRYMLRAYNNHDLEYIEKYYREFRIFTRCLFIRGEWFEHDHLREYITNEMYNYRAMLLQDERWAKK